MTYSNSKNTYFQNTTGQRANTLMLGFNPIKNPILISCSYRKTLTWLGLYESVCVCVTCQLILFLSPFYNSSYRPAIAVDFVQQQLAYDNVEDWDKFTLPFGLQFTDRTRTTLDCKNCMACLPAIAWGGLFITLWRETCCCSPMRDNKMSSWIPGKARVRFNM